MNDILLKEEILKSTSFELNPGQLFVLKTVNSTNLYAKKLINSANSHFTAVVSDSQTNGRGRMGRDFFSPEGTGIYMSIILDCKKINLPKNLLTIATGVAICRVLKNCCKADAEVKWVNDIYIKGKKVCGILAETLSEYVIMGIGINISTSVFPGKLNEIAGSVFPKNIARNEIIARVINELHIIYMEDNAQKLIDEYKSYSLVLGKKISFTHNGKAFTGIATDINTDGNLIVKTCENEMLVLNSGEVSLGSENFSR